jgi:hypothetical protein
VNNLTTNIGHILISVIMITAAVVLAIKGTITGGEAIALIAGAGGVSLGGAVASASAGVLQPSSVAVSTSPGTSSLVLNGTPPHSTASNSTETPSSSEASA